MVSCRPCVVNNKEALFHRWADSEKLYLHLGRLVPRDRMGITLEQFQSDMIIPREANPCTIKTTLGLVEFWDGTVDLVEPTSIRFLDSPGIFSEYCTLKGLK